ncbi:UNVERIFIED_CONTAM: hypothetical protein Slati_2470300 [Sesamum latifolium]|uniref:Aminotransferase-like plant mobile domain-containing protein n=1 Tax=Sesamum latifolium TaxID=2727402 RepID=A0AAW2WDU6_9LAMI
MIVKNRPFKFVDNGDPEELDHDYFIAIRSSYLTLHQGDKFIIELYSPHRFGRQFGYFQDVPGTLKYDTRAASLEEGLRYWRLCILSKSSSKAWLPGLPTNPKKFCSEAYKAWWTKVHGTFLDDNITCLISPKPPKNTLKRKKHEDKQVDGGEDNRSHVFVPSVVIKCNPQALEDEVQSIDASEGSETSHSWTTTHPLGMGLKENQLPRPPAVSVFEGESFLLNCQKEFLQKLWSDILVKISNTLVDFFSSIEDDVHLVLESMKSFTSLILRRWRNH